MAQPVLQHNLDWTPYNNTAGKLSLAAPFVNPETGLTVDPGKVDLVFSTSEYLEKIYVTVVKEGDDYGFINDVLADLTTGVVVVDYAKRSSFSTRVTLNATNHFVKGDGQYRVGLYAQNSDGYWNYEYVFVTYGGDPLKTSSKESFMVPVKTN